MKIRREDEIILEKMDREENGPWMFVGGHKAIRHAIKTDEDDVPICPLTALGLCKDDSDAVKINRLFVSAIDNHVTYENAYFGKYSFDEAKEVRRRAINIVTRKRKAIAD